MRRSPEVSQYIIFKAKSMTLNTEYVSKITECLKEGTSMVEELVQRGLERQKYLEAPKKKCWNKIAELPTN